MPLTAGFMGKIVVFSAALRQGYVWLIVIGVLNTAISAYYYLRLIIVMFFREQTSPWEAPRVPMSIAVALVITILGRVLSRSFSRTSHQRLPGTAINHRAECVKFVLDDSN